MDESQHKRFEEAVERKKAEAKEASEHPPAPQEASGGIEGSETSLVDTAYTQDAFSSRAKNTRHKKNEPGSATKR